MDRPGRSGVAVAVAVVGAHGVAPRGAGAVENDGGHDSRGADANDAAWPRPRRCSGCWWWSVWPRADGSRFAVVGRARRAVDAVAVPTVVVTNALAVRRHALFSGPLVVAAAAVGTLKTFT